MRCRQLGRTGLFVSEISLGTAEIGLDYGIAVEGEARRPPERQAEHVLHRALDLGINFIDTARVYGESERIIGNALNGRRNQFLLCSKVSLRGGDRSDSTRKKVTDSVNASLRSLATDFIDIMMVHSAPGDAITNDEVLEVLEDLRREGKFRLIGASIYGEDTALEALRSERYDCLQIAYSVLDRRPEPRVWQEAEYAGIGIIARSVLLKGALTPRRRYLSHALPQLYAAAEDLDRVARGAGITLPELAYRYVLSHTPPHTALVGTSVLHELESAVQFAESGPLSRELMTRIREIDITDPQLLNPGNWPSISVQGINETNRQ